MTDESVPPTITPSPAPAQGLIARIQAILLKPAETWDAIAAEPSDIKSIYMGYVVPLAAITPICQAIGMSVIGVGAFGFSYHTPILWAIVQAVVTYVLALVVLYVVALIINAFAPSFDGQKNMLSAFKLAAYSSTAAWLAGVFQLIPMLGILGLVGLYSCYLFWIGLPKLMKSPPEKSLVYTIVVIVVSAVASFIPAMIAGTIIGMAGIGAGAAAMHNGMMGSNGNVTGTFNINTPDGKASVNLGQMAAAASSAAAQASAMENGTAAPVKVADPAALLALMPQSFMGAARSDDSTSSGGMGGMNASTASARYTLGEGSITLEISDTGGMAGFGGMVNAMGVNASSSSAGGYSKMTTDGNRMVSEDYNNDSKSGKYGFVLNGRFAVSAEGSNVDMATLKALAGGVDLGKAEALAK